MPPYCEARVFAWYGCAALENASVADVPYEYTMSVLHWRMHQWQMFPMSTL